ncbi:MAG: DUF6089 family protein [Bacteroidota bacterium]
MMTRLKFTLFILLSYSVAIEAQKIKLPSFLGKKRGSTQWYGDPVSERKLKNNYNIYSTVGLGGGTSNYYGDMTSYKYPISTILKGTRWNLSANYTKHFSYNFAARIALSYARITGDDANYEEAEGLYLVKYSRGLHFRNDLKEISLVGIYDFTRYRKGGYMMRPKYTPFVLGGLAIVNHNPRARAAADPISGAISNDWVKLREFDTEGQGDLGKKQYSTISFAIPLGAGLRYKLADQLDFTIEGGIRYTISEGGKYLDDVSRNYIPSSGTNPNPSPSEMFSYRAKELYAARTGKLRDFSKITPPITVTPSGNPTERGNGRQDWYFFTILQLNYYIPSQIKCITNR